MPLDAVRFHWSQIPVGGHDLDSILLPILLCLSRKSIPITRLYVSRKVEIYMGFSGNLMRKHEEAGNRLEFLSHKTRFQSSSLLDTEDI
jgi:hypothetical protein